MGKKSFKRWLRQSLDPSEMAILSNYYFSLQKYLKYSDKFNLIGKYLLFRASSQPSNIQPEISFLLYSKACERLLIPLLVNLLQRPEVREKKCKINLIVLGGVHQLKLNSSIIERLKELGCPIQTDYFSLIRACQQPKNKLVVVCLDHRLAYQFHKCGVDTVDKLKEFGVKTVSIQHGGTREDSVKELASSASDTIMVWGRRVWRELTDKYGVDSSRVKLVGNPLHDRLTLLNQKKILNKLVEIYPQVKEHLPQKKIVLLATCLHTEYRDYDNEQELYQEYVRHIYQSLDFSQVFLLVKMHPLDKREPNLYRQAAQEYSNESIIIIEPEVTELDIYRLLFISDLLLTRCSTVGEEALMMGKKVVAFDLFASGPSKGYKHLEEYGTYTTAYASPKEALKEGIATALFSVSNGNKKHNLEEEITYCLDGNSTNRAVDEVLKQLFK